MGSKPGAKIIHWLDNIYIFTPLNYFHHKPIVNGYRLGNVYKATIPVINFTNRNKNPYNDISGAKILRSRALPAANRAGQAFRQAAITVARSATTPGAFYRRKRAQGGPLFAQVATAHKIARVVYDLLTHNVQFADIGAEAYEKKQRERALA